MNNYRTVVPIHTPPINTDKRVNPEAPINSTSLRERWMWTSYIELAGGLSSTAESVYA